MDLNNIILCTDAPKNTGLAYYYYLALKDVFTGGKVILIDEGTRRYDASLMARAERKLSNLSGKSSVEKMRRILDHCDPAGKNVVILFNTADIRYEEMQKLSADPSIYLIHLLSDHPSGMYASRAKLTIDSLPLFDIVVAFAHPLVPVLYQQGARRVERIPFGYCRYTHFISDTVEEPALPERVYYFGTWTPAIEKWLAHLKGFDLHIEGSFWRNASDKWLKELGTKPDPNTDKRMAIMARKAGVVVNFTRASHGCFHTMKTFELPVAGACVATNYSDEQAEFFKPGLSMAYFNTPEEMREQIKDLLADRQKNQAIRSNALQAALQHSYHARAATLLLLLKTT